VRRFFCWFSLGLVAVPPSFAFQRVESPKSALERRGLFHVDISGRFISPAGDGVSGVHVQLTAGGIRALPLADAGSDRDGRFTFHDVSSPYTPNLLWYPPEEWMRGGVAVMGESGEKIDAGTIQLQPDTVIRVAVEVAGDAPPAPLNRTSNSPAVGNAGPIVVLQGKGQFGARILGVHVGRIQVLRQIPFDEGDWEVSLFENRKIERYRAPFHVQRGRRDQLILLRVLRATLKPQNQSSSEGKLEVSETLLPPAPIDREFEASGRVLAPDDSPIEGAFVGVMDIPFRSIPPQWTASDSQGKFQLKYRSTGCYEPGVSYGNSDYWSIPRETVSQTLSCDERWHDPRDVVMPFATRLLLKADGVDAAKVQAFWWHGSLGWQRFSSLQPWISLSSLGEKEVKVEADGFLPELQALKLPFLNSLYKERPPESVTVEFHLDRTAQRDLIARGNGKPLIGARVDVETITDLQKDTRRVLRTYRTPTDGRIRLMGGADRLVEVFVYADGFEPRRAIWNSGAALTLDLTPRSSTLSFAPSSAALLARIRDASAPNAIRTVKLSTTRPSLLKVPGGTYDITMYGNRGAVTGYQRTAVKPGQVTAIDESLDQRPRLTVRYPADGWHATISESVPRGNATNWVAMIAVAGAPTFSDIPATMESESAREAVFLLSHAGRMHVELRRANQTLSLWRDITVAPGESVSVDIPSSSGVLKGSMRTYDGGTFSSEHGFAGPRMQLISDDPAGWSATDYIPKRDGANGRFTVKGLPPGSYHLYQHLIGEPATFDGKRSPYMSPIAAWGGIPVKLEAGAATELRDFIEYPYQDLRVRVTDQSGRPLDHATLRIRDRMSESWRQVEENPLQVEQAAHPIPYPAAARIVGGAATLPRVRAGWLDLFVELDSGAAYSFTASVTLDQELRLSLPAPETR